jgi:hypothetical protein
VNRGCRPVAVRVVLLEPVRRDGDALGAPFGGVALREAHATICGTQKTPLPETLDRHEECPGFVLTLKDCVNQARSIVIDAQYAVHLNPTNKLGAGYEGLCQSSLLPPG